jgi:alkylhydroperoxidase family enzyme
VSRGASEELVDKVRNYEASDLPERTKAALRLADELTGDRPLVDEGFYADLAAHFSDDQILDLGMCIAFASGWQRFIEAFGIVPDQWRDGSPLPWEGG